MERWQLENDNFIDINLSSIHKKISQKMQCRHKYQSTRLKFLEAH